MRNRKEAVEKVRKRLRSPRIQMAVVLALAGTTGFLVSALLMHLGLERLGIRYFIAVSMGYAAFLLFLGLWLRSRRAASDAADLLDLSSDVIESSLSGTDASSSITSVEDLHLGGGRSGGGGATGYLEGKPLSVAPPAKDAAGFTADWLTEGDSDVFPILIGITVVLLTACASLYVVYLAPTLFAELIVDGLLVGGVYSRLRHFERRHWLSSAIRTTWLPATLTALAFAVAGYLLQTQVPDARSFAEALRLFGRE